jgi:nucleotide-binding universal stress UspA family protein
MVSVRRVLCPVDFSDTSHAALRYAVDVCQRYDAALTLLHVYHAPGFTLPEGMVVAGADVFADVLRDVEIALARWREEAVKLGARSVATATAAGATHPEIARFADDNGFDLVVIGTHGRTGIAHALLGSTAEKVVRYAHCPVLTVRAAPEDKHGLPSQEQ